jgi:hypothetical protein
MRDKPIRRLTKKQQSQVVKWLGDAYNMAFARIAASNITPAERDRRRAISEDALIEAVQDYDASKGASFTTFLYRKIQWRILDANRPRRSKVAQAKTFTDIEAE